MALGLLLLVGVGDIAEIILGAALAGLQDVTNVDHFHVVVIALLHQD